ncbi:hypothetical protein [Chryseobacterium jejuense]|uniref:hypothetical protein n=1 Tax=Chryseobacterium jejuense TaxID=445960 RepID=UPI001AE4533A|nr:hypothetical protein [Chryseobacterium jejuense]MBP2616519.1 putative membrane protein [Chryseobacterium jejuense]
MKKAITYLILFILYCLVAFPIAAIDDILKSDNFYLVTSLGFGILNSIITFIILKWKDSFNIITAFSIAFIALAIAYLLMEVRWAPDWDDYGMITAICTNAISSIVLWEIAFQIKKKYISSNEY